MHSLSLTALLAAAGVVGAKVIAADKVIAECLARCPPDQHNCNEVCSLWQDNAWPPRTSTGWPHATSTSAQWTRIEPSGSSTATSQSSLSHSVGSKQSESVSPTHTSISSPSVKPTTSVQTLSSSTSKLSSASFNNTSTSTRVSSSRTASTSSTPSSCENGNTPNSRNCWSKGYDIDTNWSESWPDTGVTRSYSFQITNGTANPDGAFDRTTFLVNGQYIGPTIYADWGDYVEVAVTNHLQDNGTGIHWHGIRQWNTNAEDGVPGVTECPLAPGQSRVYRWQATQYGTSWYHSHIGVQYGDGVVGGIVINGPSTANYDQDLGMLPVSDWYYQTASACSDIVGHFFGRPPTTADNGLVNSTMVSPSGTAGKYYVTELLKGKKYKLRLINMSVDNHFMVSLDGHPFEVIAADFVPIEPFTADWIFLAIGQRYDVIINANQTVDNYWFRAEAQDQANCGDNNNNGNIKSIFRYEGANAVNPTSQATAYTQRCSDDNTSPYQSLIVPKAEEFGQLDSAINIGVEANGTSIVSWGINSTAMNVMWEKPTLSYVVEGNNSFPKAANVISLPDPNQWSYWVIEEVAGQPISVNIPHPIHLHGHDFYVLGSGAGDFASTGGSTLNYNNPPRRDTTMLPAGGWLVLAFQTDNPGAWLMHCHIAWHAEEGMAIQFLEDESELKAQVKAPSTAFADACAGWNSYYPEHSYYVRGFEESGI